MLRLILKLALLLFPGFLIAQVPNRGTQYFRDSIQAISQRILKDPSNADLFAKRAGWKSLIKDNYGALADFTTAIKLDSKDALSYVLRGDTYNTLEQYTNAIPDFNKAIQFNQNDLFAFEGRARSKAGLEDYRGAYSDLTTCIEIARQQGFSELTVIEAYYNRGVLQVYYLNKKESGCLDLSKAGELGYNTAYEVIKEKCN